MSSDESKGSGPSISTPVATDGGPRPLTPTIFKDWKRSLQSARSGADLLSALTESHDAEKLVQALAVDDLHHYVQRVGMGDAEGILALASSEQVQGMLDCEIWDRDDFSVERVDPWLATLMRAGPEVLGKHIMALDDALINRLVRTSTKVLVVEDPDSFDPPDVEHVVTPDNRLCICFPESASRDLPIKIFLDWLIQTNSVYCVNLLVMSSAALDANLEEDAYRWRSGRMADRGYIDYYEALSIYVPPRDDQIKEAAASIPDDAPAVERWLIPLIRGERRLEDAFGALLPAEMDRVQAGVALAANMMFSADRVELWDEEQQAQVLQRLRAGLVLGLESVAGAVGDPVRDATVLTETAPAFIFRTGYGRVLEAQAPLRAVLRQRRLADEDSATGAMDLPSLQRWTEVLSARHPHLKDGKTPNTATDLRSMRDAAELIASLANAAGDGRPAEVGIGAWLITGLVRHLMGMEGTGPLPAPSLVAAHGELFVEGELREESVAAAESWWRTIDGGELQPLRQLLSEAHDQMGGLSPDALEIRFVPLLWFGSQAGEND